MNIFQSVLFYLFHQKPQKAIVWTSGRNKVSLFGVFLDTKYFFVYYMSNVGGYGCLRKQVF